MNELIFPIYSHLYSQGLHQCPTIVEAQHRHVNKSSAELLTEGEFEKKLDCAEFNSGSNLSRLQDLIWQMHNEGY